MLNAEMMATTAIPSGPVELIPAGTVAAECHVTRRTIGRWILDAAIGFPAPIEINKRLYFKRAELEAWKLSRVAASCRMGAR
jgi:predicted DNA-binding transcriptional regulator AlpA